MKTTEQQEKIVSRVKGKEGHKSFESKQIFLSSNSNGSQMSLCSSYNTETDLQLRVTVLGSSKDSLVWEDIAHTEAVLSARGVTGNTGILRYTI